MQQYSKRWFWRFKTTLQHSQRHFTGEKKDKYVPAEYFIMLSILAFERLAKKVGIKRISKDALEEARDIIVEEGADIAERAFKISRHANRKTVMIDDVKFFMRHEK